MAVLHLKAHEQDVHTAVLASRKELERLVLGDRDMPLLRGWRGALVGADLVGMLKGDSMLSVDDGHLRLVALPRN